MALVMGVRTARVTGMLLRLRVGDGSLQDLPRERFPRGSELRKEHERDRLVWTGAPMPAQVRSLHGYALQVDSLWVQRGEQEAMFEFTRPFAHPVDEVLAVTKGCSTASTRTGGSSLCQRVLVASDDHHERQKHHLHWDSTRFILGSTTATQPMHNQRQRQRRMYVAGWRDHLGVFAMVIGKLLKNDWKVSHGYVIGT